MRFASVRDFRVNVSSFLQGAAKDEIVVVTLRGKPRALFVPIEEERLEEMTRAFHAARLRVLVEKLRAQAEKAGTSKMSMAEINREIRAARRSRRA